MLGLTPVRQARHGRQSIKPECSQPSSRAAVRGNDQQQRHKAAIASHQPARAFAGGHAASPCASAAAAAAAAPTATQDLLVHVVREEPAQRYAQHQVDVGQLQLHQLQHHGQVLLQQQLEHLHHQQRQRQRQRAPQHPDPQQQAAEKEHAQQQLQQQQQQASPPPPPPPPGELLIDPQHAASRQELQVPPLQRSSSSTHGDGDAVSEAAAAATAAAAVQVVQPQPMQLPGKLPSSVPSAAHTSRGNSNGSRTPSADSSSTPKKGKDHQASSSSALQAHTGQPVAGSSRRAVQELAATAHASSVERPAQAPLGRQQQQQVQEQQQVEQQQQWQQQRPLERTPDGLPLVRLRRGLKPAQVAAVLCSCLAQEGQVVLSAAGAELALLALNCLERAVTLQQELQPGLLLLATPRFRSSRRPVGGGRCQVYDLVCSLQPAGVQRQQQQQQWQTQQQHGLHQHAAGKEQQPKQQQEQQSSALRWEQQHQQSSRAGHRRQAVPSQHVEAAAWQPPALQVTSCCNGRQPGSTQPGCEAGPVASSTQHSPQRQLLGLQATAVLQPDTQQQQQQHVLQEGWHARGLRCGQGLSDARQPLLQQAANGNGRHVQQLLHGNQHQCSQQRQPQPGLDSQLLSQHHAPATAAWQHVQQQQHHHHQQRQAHGPATAPTGHADALSAAAAAPGHAVAPRFAMSQADSASVPQQAAQARLGASGVGGAGVVELKVSGCSLNFADALEDALAIAPAAVLLPVAHAKQAVRALEGVSLLSTRMQQRHRRQLWLQQVVQDGPCAGSGDSGSDSSSSSSEAGAVAGVQLVLQPRRGKVCGQGGAARGLHVFVYAAPTVQ